MLLARAYYARAYARTHEGIYYMINNYNDLTWGIFRTRYASSFGS